MIRKKRLKESLLVQRREAS